MHFQTFLSRARDKHTISTYLIAVDVYFNSIAQTSSTPLKIKVIELNFDELQAWDYKETNNNTTCLFKCELLKKNIH